MFDSTTMQEGLVFTTLRRVNRNKMIFGIVMAVLPMIILAFFYRYWFNFFSGPFVTEPSVLTSIDKPGDLFNYYVTVTGEDGYDSGYYYYTQENNGPEKVESYYMLLFFRNRYLIVQTDNPVPSNIYTGTIVDFPSDVRDEVLEPLQAEYPNYTFLPYMLDSKDFITGGYVGLVVAGIFILIGGLIFINGLIGKLNPTSTRIWKNLEKYGSAEVIANQIDMEMAAEHANIGALHVTRNWLVQSSKTTINFTRLVDLAWLYKKVTTTRTYGVVTSRTFSVLLYDRNGMSITSIDKEEKVNQALGMIFASAPWAVAGYSADLEKMWRKDRAGFLALVDKRRAEVNASRSSQA